MCYTYKVSLFTTEIKTVSKTVFLFCLRRKNFMKNSEKLARAIGLVTLVTFIAKGLGILRDALQARAFGAETFEVTMFTAANNSTIYIFTTVAYALCLAAVPIFSKKLIDSKEECFKAADYLISLCFIVSLVVCGLLLIFNYTGLLASFDNVEGSPVLFERFVLYMVPTLPIIVISYLLVALFQSMGHYSLQGSLSLLYNAFLCFVLLFANKSLTMDRFVILTSGAWLLQFAMVVPYIIKEKYRFRFRFGIYGTGAHFGLFFRTAIVTIFTTSVFLFCYLLDYSMAFGISKTAPTSFYYADKLFTPLITTLMYSIGAVLFPQFNLESSRMSAKDYRSYIGKVIENTVVLLLPLSVLFCVYGVQIIEVLFEGSEFTHTASIATGTVFGIYSLGMVGFALLDLLSKAYYAMQKTITPLIINAVVVVLNFAVGSILLHYYSHSAILAIATSVSMTLGGIILCIVFFKGHGTPIKLMRILKSIILSIVMGVILWELNAIVLNGGESKIMLMVKCGFCGVIGFIAYLLLFGDSELLTTFKNKIFKNRSK